MTGFQSGPNRGYIGDRKIIIPSRVLEVDGGDFIELPLSDDFDMTFEIFTPSGITAFSGGIWWAAPDDTSIGLITHANSPTDKHWNLNIFNSDVSFSATIDGVVNGVGVWIKIRIRKVGNTVQYWENDILRGSETATGTMTSPWETIGLGGYSEGGGTVPSIYAINGSQFKNVFGPDYIWGNMWTDIPRTNPAVVTDPVASVENLGTLGGYMEQATPTRRPQLISIP